MYEFTLGGHATVDFTLGVGSMLVSASDRCDITVDVAPTDPANPADVRAASECTVDLVGTTVVVKANRTWRAIGPRRRDGSIAVTVQTSAGTDVRGGVALGDFTGTGPLGSCQVRAAMGSVEVETATSAKLASALGDLALGHCTGHAELVSSTGKIRARTVDGSVTVKNSNGLISLGSVAGDLRVKSANGDVELERAGTSVVVKTSCGSIRVGEAIASDIVADTKVGSIDVGVRDGSAAWLDVHTKYGHISSELAASPAPDKTDHVVRLNAKTTGGNITIRRSVALD